MSPFRIVKLFTNLCHTHLLLFNLSLKFLELTRELLKTSLDILKTGHLVYDVELGEDLVHLCFHVFGAQPGCGSTTACGRIPRPQVLVVITRIQSLHLIVDECFDPVQKLIFDAHLLL